MPMFWDISPYHSPDTESLIGDRPNTRRLMHATYMLTESLGGDPFPSDATRESILRWASEEKTAGRYIGHCRVLDLRSVAHVIRPNHLAPDLFGKVSRILIRTRSELHQSQPVLTAESVKLLASCGIKLIGMDTPSLDAPNSANREAYKMALQLGISIMLNLNLDDVRGGDYELIALPIGDAKGGTLRDLEIQHAKSLTTRAA